MAIMVVEMQLKLKTQEIKSGILKIYSDYIAEHLKWPVPTSPWAALEMLEAVLRFTAGRGCQVPSSFSHQRTFCWQR